MPDLSLSPRRGRLASTTTFEFVLAGFVILGIVLALSHLLVKGYLPQPFYYRPDDTFMDLYSTAYWSHTAGAYTVWHSIYPPLSFAFLKLVSLDRCYGGGAILGRSCDWPPLAALGAFFLANAMLVFFSLRAVDARTAWPRTLAIAFSLPMLYAFERGNLLIPCFTCFVLAFGDLLLSRGGRWLAMALAMNFKPYLVFSVLPFVGRRVWGGLIVCGVLFVAVYGLTFVVAESGSPLQVIGNESRYAAAKSANLFSDVYFATSYWPLIRLLRAAPTGMILAPPAAAAAIGLALEILIRLSQLAFFSCCALALLRPAPIDVRRFGAMVACISLTAFTTGSAGYVQIFLFFLLFYEPWRGPIRIVILTGAYLLCLPIDHVFLPVVCDQAVSFLSGREVVTRFGLSWGQLARPGILLIIQAGLVALNFADLLAPGAGSPGRPANPVWFSTSRS